MILLCILALARAEIVAEYNDPHPGMEFQSLLRDPNSGHLFLGGTNALLRLDSQSLKLEQRHKTGPQSDSPYCSWDGRDCIKPLSGVYVSAGRKAERSQGQELHPNASRVPTNNVNQILLLEPSGGLLACGSLFQGICAVHEPSDLDVLRVGHGQAAGQIPVAANSGNKSTAAFIGPGPGADGKTQVLYVGATFTHPYYRDTFPAVASRRLDDKLLHLVDEGDVTGRSGLDIRAEFRGDFKVHYVSGFAAGSYAFWATLQRNSPTTRNAPFVSKLLRICDSDLRYDSYSELPLECLGPDNSHYNLLQSTTLTRLPPKYLSSPAEEHQLFLVGVFAKGRDPYHPGRQSAVCVFPMRDISAMFEANANRCLSGIGSRNLPHFGLDSKCHNVSHLRLPQNDCQPGHIGGTLPLSKLALHIFKDSLLTSVASTDVGGFAVLLFGTSNGRLKKMVLEELGEGREFGEIVLSKARKPVGPTLIVDDGHLFATAGNKVVKVRLGACEGHSTCSVCLQSADPFCGWCTLENRCSTRNSCRHSGLPFGWQAANRAPGSDDEGRCPRLLAGTPSPANLSIAAPVEERVMLSMNLLPPPSEEDIYQCVFGDSNYIRAEFKEPGTLSCPLPPFATRPAVPHKLDHVVVPLRLWSGRTTQIFFETSFTFYDCEAHNLCTTCVGSSWGCDWCLLDNRCVHQASLCTNQTRTEGASECPHIEAGALAGHEIRLPSGHPAPIRVPVANLHRLISAGHSVGLESVECSVEVAGSPGVRSEGTLGPDGWVTCAPRAYSYPGEGARHKATLYLSAGGSTLIDKTTVELYKCAELAGDCSRCLSLAPGYGCTWCGGGCHFRPQCPFGTASGESDPRSVCPAPTILEVTPLSGPLEGGTRVTIRGRDLGTTEADIRKRILIAARVPCVLVDYKPSIEITCVTANSGRALSGPVSVSIGAAKKSGSSGAEFAFVTVTVTAFSPTFGPMSGGTRITVHGTHLDAGSERSVSLIGAGSLRLACTVDPETVRSDSLQCLTQSVPHPGFVTQKLELVQDGANRSLSREFRFTPDPEVEGVTPLTSFRAGGRLLSIRGRFLNVTREPRMFLLDPTVQRKESDPLPLVSGLAPCSAQSDTLMVCESPPMLPRRSKRALSEDLDLYESWPIGFMMDGVKSVRNLASLAMRVVPDPEFLPFPGGRKLYREEGDPLILEGRQLSLAATASDVRVTIGMEPCNVTLVAANQLVCEPPPTQPWAADGLPEVVVQLGRLEFRLGRLGYASSGGLSVESSILGSVTVIGSLAAVAAGVALCVVVAVAVWWRRKSCQAEKEYRRIQLQMDSLESNVRLECKQAFAELQTDMSDLTSDLVAIGIPFHSRRSVPSHPLPLESNVRLECKQAFAELQTDMSDLTSDLVAIGIPFHSRRSVPSHPLPLESNVRLECKQAFAELQTDMSDLTSDLVAIGIPFHSRRSVPSHPLPLESNVRLECKQAFAELQTDMSDLTSDLVAIGIPFHSRRSVPSHPLPLESNVRLECKQAFAELQTDMSDLTSDLVAIGIPFHSRRSVPSHPLPLESNVRLECKQAFAELQTDMSDLTSDLVAIGIPFHSRRSVPSHPLPLESNVRLECKQAFAELQTDMSDLTSDLVAIGIPFHSRRSVPSHPLPLESNVRLECKQAFAELQTDMSDLTSDLVAIGIPFHSRRSVPSHPLPLESNVRLECKQAFAELQTDMSDLTSDLVAIGIPFHSRRSVPSHPLPLESNVRLECKQAFAELQTDMSDLTSDLVAIGIPFHSRRSVPSHPLPLESNVRLECKQAFAELQTDMSDLTSDLVAIGIPFHSRRSVPCHPLPLESNVRLECKQAFAELQTDMSDLTSDLVAIGIPFHSRRSVPSHPLPLESNVRLECKQAFAELQTDMSDLTSDLVAIGIPFHSRRSVPSHPLPLESNVRLECKQAFAELQTDMSDLTSDLVAIGIPFHSRRSVPCHPLPLESNVRLECKQAFAELQTDMSDLTSDLVAIGIPFHSRRSVPSHPLPLESNVRLECKQAFAELQTDMSDLTSDLVAIGIPFHSRRSVPCHPLPLESNVRLECKQAFAELQTDMSDLTSDLVAIGIPFHSRRSVPSHPLPLESNVRLECKQAFAELQTDMSDLTSDLVAIGIPFHSRRSVPSHPLPLESNVRLECKQAFAELQTDMSDLTSDLVAIGIPFHSRRSVPCHPLPLESNVRLECKQAFAELQTDMSDLTSDLVAIGIPFHSRRVYAAKILFKEDQQQTLLLDWQQTSGAGYSSHLQLALAQFENLLWSREFVIGLVEGLEAEPSFSAGDRVYVASLLTATLARNMDYLTDIVLALLRGLIARSLESRSSPQLMLRRAESVVEKMLSNWLALCLYDYMQEEAGSSLFLLLKALKHQIEKGPVDAVTGDARYSLSEDRLLREQIKAEPLTLHVIQSSGTGRSRMDMGGFADLSCGGKSVACRVLSCDSVGQAKGKILDCLFRNHPFGSRPAVADFDLEWQSPRGPVTLLDDERCGSSPPMGGGWKRLNTLATYRLAEQSLGQPLYVALIAKRTPSNNYVHPSQQHSSAYASMSSSSLLIPNGHHSPESWDSGASSSSAGVSAASAGTRYWHLVPPSSLSGYDSGLSTLTSRRDRYETTATLPKSIPEIYLTRLLTSKGTVQKFVDDFFAAALRVQTPTFPVVIKYLFDFLETEARSHQVEDPSVVHAWKNNALHLRFWVNLIKNPEFVFDAEKSPTVDSALSVIAATFMDASSPSQLRLGKDSPSNKLLFAKDIPRYREAVTDFYHRIRCLPPVPEPQLKSHLASLSKAYATEFNVLGTVRELMCYVVKYQEGILVRLDNSEHMHSLQLRDRLHGVLMTMSGDYSPPSEHVYASVS